jgi:hypothetical protein
MVSLVEFLLPVFANIFTGMFLWATRTLDYLTANMFFRMTEVVHAIDKLPLELSRL